jgi:hypothetical protein
VARFVGGPCNGQDAGPALYGTRVCGGVNYTLAEDGNYHYGTGFGGSVSGSVGNPGNVYGAWSNLMRSIGVGTPHAVNRSRAGRRRLRRVVR